MAKTYNMELLVIMIFISRLGKLLHYHWLKKTNLSLREISRFGLPDISNEKFVNSTLGNSRLCNSNLAHQTCQTSKSEILKKETSRLGY